MCLPVLGRLLSLYALTEGKLALGMFAFSGLLLRILGSRLGRRSGGTGKPQEENR